MSQRIPSWYLESVSKGCAGRLSMAALVKDAAYLLTLVCGVKSRSLLPAISSTKTSIVLFMDRAS